MNFQYRSGHFPHDPASGVVGNELHVDSIEMRDAAILAAERLCQNAVLAISPFLVSG
jgi:hypothetical protein